MSKKSKIREALELSQKRIRSCEARIAALHFSMDELSDIECRRGAGRDAFNTLHSILCSQLNDAYRNFFMFSGLLDEDVAKRANREAYEHFLSTGHSIMQYLGFKGTWSVLEETLFREEIEARVKGRRK